MQLTIFQNHSNVDMLLYTTCNPEACAVAHPTLTVWLQQECWPVLKLNETRLGSMHHEIFFWLFVIYTTHAIFQQWHTTRKRGPSRARQITSYQPHKHWKNYVSERKGKDVVEQVRRGKWTWAVRMWCCSRCFMMRLWRMCSRRLEVCFLIF